MQMLQDIGRMDGGRKGFARPVKTHGGRVEQASRAFREQAQVERGREENKEMPMAYLIRRAVSLDALRKDWDMTREQPGYCTRGAGGRRMAKTWQYAFEGGQRGKWENICDPTEEEMPPFASYERIAQFIGEMDPEWGRAQDDKGIQAQLDILKGPKAGMGKHHDHAACEGLVAVVGLQGARKQRWTHRKLGITVTHELEPGYVVVWLDRYPWLHETLQEQGIEEGVERATLTLRKVLPPFSELRRRRQEKGQWP